MLNSQRKQQRAFVGLAGSAFSKRAPKPRDPLAVLVHFCFDQESDEQQPERCNCSLRITKRKASEYVDAGKAKFLLVKNAKKQTLVKFHYAIVVRQILIDDKFVFAIPRPDGPIVSESKREEKHNAIANTIRGDARRVLQKLLAKGAISPKEAKPSDAGLEALFQNSDMFCVHISSQKRLQSEWLDVVKHWFNNILALGGLGVDAGLTSDADRGEGLQLTGGYGHVEVQKISDAHDSDTGRVTTANHRAGYWNGAWDYSPGTSPDPEKNFGPPDTQESGSFDSSRDNDFDSPVRENYSFDGKPQDD